MSKPGRRRIIKIKLRVYIQIEERENPMEMADLGGGDSLLTHSIFRGKYKDEQYYLSDHI